VDIEARLTGVEPPRGFHQARVDEKGRLKLPAVFQQFLKALGEETVFITTLDMATVRIYPTSLWKQNEIFFENAKNPAAEQISFLANMYGADSEIDSQGRVLIPQELRRDLRLENHPVWLGQYKGRINAYGKDEFEKRATVAKANAQDNLIGLESEGLK
jgi:MraZ protein